MHFIISDAIVWKQPVLDSFDVVGTMIWYFETDILPCPGTLVTEWSKATTYISQLILSHSRQILLWKIVSVGLPKVSDFLQALQFPPQFLNWLSQYEWKNFDWGVKYHYSTEVNSYYAYLLPGLWVELDIIIWLLVPWSIVLYHVYLIRTLDQVSNQTQAY